SGSTIAFTSDAEIDTNAGGTLTSDVGGIVLDATTSVDIGDTVTSATLVDIDAGTTVNIDGAISAGATVDVDTATGAITVNAGIVAGDTVTIDSADALTVTVDGSIDTT